jgi:chaperone modulatory protein CbpM
MRHEPNAGLPGVIVEDGVQFTLVELSVACHANTAQVIALIEEGVITPSGDAVERWRFDGVILPRARTAVRLMRDLQLNAAGAAVALDLLNEIERLRARLRQFEGDRGG